MGSTEDGHHCLAFFSTKAALEGNQRSLGAVARLSQCVVGAALPPY